MSNLQLQTLAKSSNVEPEKLQQTLMQTVFKNAKPEEFTALLMVANNYGLNPILKELYAFPAKGGGIVPVVSADGWYAIINRHPQMDGMEVAVSDDGGACTVSIFRKDRAKPTVVTELLKECKRNTEPWNQMPSRMLRHKAIIQCARVAFGLGGIHDEDEAHDIAERPTTGRVVAPLPLAQPSERDELRKALATLARDSQIALADLAGIATLNALTTEKDGEREVLTLDTLRFMVENWETLRFSADLETSDVLM